MPTLAVIWRAAGLLLATDAGSVMEVLPPVACRPMPGAPGWIRGVFVHRGELVPLVDAEGLLSGLSSSQPPLVENPLHADRMRNRVLLIRLPAAGGVSDWRVGLWVESILELERIEFAGAGTYAGFDTDAARFMGAVASTRFGLVQLVETHRLFTPEQAGVLRRQLSEAAA